MERKGTPPKGRIQHSKVIQDQVSEAKDNCRTIFEHKLKIQDIILMYQSKPRAQNILVFNLTSDQFFC